MNRPDRLELPPEVVEIAATLEEAGYETWCVGGAVRDAVLGESKDDVDLATRATPEEVQRLFRRTVPVGVKFGTVGVVDKHRHLHEVTTFRRDVTTDGRHAVVEYGASLDEDLARRDLTINAISYHPLRHTWHDPFDGIGDLGRGVIRAVGDPAERFREDYLRILRALRFSARFDFAIDPATWTAARLAAEGLTRLSAERVRDEWFRGLQSARSVARFLALWREVGAADLWLAGLATEYPLATDSPDPRDPVLLTVALVEHPDRVLTQLKASTAEIERARRAAGACPVPAGKSDEAVRRWLSNVGHAADDLATLHGWRTGLAAPWVAMVQGIRARGEAIDRGGLAVTGDDLRALGVAPGKDMGRILAALLDHVLTHPADNDRARLLQRAEALK